MRMCMRMCTPTPGTAARPPERRTPFAHPHPHPHPRPSTNPNPNPNPNPNNLNLNANPNPNPNPNPSPSPNPNPNPNPSPSPSPNLHEKLWLGAFEERDARQPRLVALPHHLALQGWRHERDEFLARGGDLQVLGLVEVFAQPSAQVGLQIVPDDVTVELIHPAVELHRVRAHRRNDATEGADDVAPEHATAEHEDGVEDLLGDVLIGGVDVAVANARDRHDRPIWRAWVWVKVRARVEGEGEGDGDGDRER